MNRNIVLFLLILISICTISHVSAIDNLDVVASDNNDVEVQIINESTIIESEEIDDDYQGNGDDSDLRGQIASTEEGGTLNINGTYYCEYFIEINKTITIEGVGEGATVIYNGSEDQSFFFHINSTASNVVLKNIKFIDGTFLWGAAINCDGNNCRIINCEFINGQATGANAQGGAILVLANNCTIINSTFKNNKADASGGAVVFNGTNGSIINCKFEDNEALGDNSRGGAIAILGNNYNITNCSFSNNKAKKYGGAIYIEGENYVISNCEFKDNALAGSNGHGGALLINANNCIVKDSVFTNNHCLEQGGAIYIQMKHKNNYILKCNFTGNHVSNGYAGAIYSSNCSLIINGSNFTNNHAESGGGAILLFNKHNATIKNSYFNANEGSKYGNDILIFNTTVDIDSNYFVIDFDETMNDAIYAKDISIDDLIKNNTFYKIKKPSSVKFDAGMVFTYGGTGSIHVTVIGGTIEKSNMVIKNNKNAQINIKDDVITVSNLPVGNYKLYVTTTPDENHTAFTDILSITVKKASASVSSQKAKVQLKNKAYYWSCTITDSRTHKGIAGMKVILKIYTGKKYKKVTVTTKSNGVVKYKTSSLKKGAHKVIVSGSHAGYNAISFKSSISVVKPIKLSFKVDHKTLKDRSSIMFRIFNKQTKKGLNNVVLNLKIKTGKKVVKIVTLKTLTKAKKKGIIGFSTNELSAGKHIVILEPDSVKYSGKMTSSLKLTKSQVKHHPITVMDTAKKYPIKVIK